MHLRWHKRDNGTAAAQLYVMDSETFRKYPLEIFDDLTSVGAFIIGLNEAMRPTTIRT